MKKIPYFNIEYFAFRYFVVFLMIFGLRAGIMDRYKESSNVDNLIVMANKPPKWNEQMQAHCLNFHGRVTHASVKNFQLVSDENKDHIILQFGKVTSKIMLCASTRLLVHQSSVVGVCRTLLMDSLMGVGFARIRSACESMRSAKLLDRCTVPTPRRKRRWHGRAIRTISARLVNHCRTRVNPLGLRIHANCESA